jgi:hypothetical protein
MTYAVIYAQNGEFVADFDSQDEAVEALRDYVADHPSVTDQVGLMEFDDDGRPAGEFVPASALASEHEQYA